VWVGTLHPRTTVLWGEKRQSVKELAVRLRLRWRSQLGVGARAVVVYTPKYGSVRLVVTRDRHGNFEYV
jgi:hypothetical protein